tara:strand:+ start:3151 stop:4695 length:1545 start_codon:yes stop_codon:yes gene_type:complete
MKVTRWPAIFIFTLLISASLIIQPDNEVASNSVLQKNQPSLVGDAKNLSSTWYCVAGSVGGAGLANHEVLIGNPSNVESSVLISVVSVLAPNQQDLNGEPEGTLLDVLQLPIVQKELPVPPRAVTSVKLSEIEGVSGEFASALIQSNLGNLIVEHRLTGSLGSAQSACASTTSPEWNFAAGTTRLGTREMIFLFNPYPDSAVLDITFAADGRTRRPDSYNGLVVPPQSLLPIDVTSVVTLAETISTQITARTGRIVAERLVMFGDEIAPNGLDAEVGSPSLNDLWMFPGGMESEALASLTIFNPSETEVADVDVEIIPDVSNVGYVEPISVAVPAASSRAVNFVIDQEGRDPALIDASTRIAKGIPFWVVVRSINGVPIASERVLIASSEGNLSSGFNPGVSVSGEEHYLILQEPSGKVAIANPASDRLTLLQIEAFSNGEIFSSQVIEVSAKSRKIIDLQQLGVPENSVLRIVSTEPVGIERYIGTKNSGDWGNVSPAAVNVSDLYVSPPEFD